MGNLKIMFIGYIIGFFVAAFIGSYAFYKHCAPMLEPEIIVEREIYLIHETEPARITCYLWTGNKAANGEYPSEGMVASSDRSIPFGTEVIIDGKKYIVGDRTNHRFQDFETQTMDIYWEGLLEDCLKFGVQYKDIAIINNL